MRILNIFFSILLLSSCSLSNDNNKALSENLGKTIYQPRILILEKNSIIKTKEGNYIPQNEEIWHADGVYKTLEAKYINLISEDL